MIFPNTYSFPPDSEEEFVKRYTPFLDSLDLDETERKNNLHVK